MEEEDKGSLKRKKPEKEENAVDLRSQEEIDQQRGFNEEELRICLKVIN
jgi:hypothetical protein